MRTSKRISRNFFLPNSVQAACPSSADDLAAQLGLHGPEHNARDRIIVLDYEDGGLIVLGLPAAPMSGRGRTGGAPCGRSAG